MYPEAVKIGKNCGHSNRYKSTFNNEFDTQLCSCRIYDTIYLIKLFSLIPELKYLVDDRAVEMLDVSLNGYKHSPQAARLENTRCIYLKLYEFQYVYNHHIEIRKELERPENSHLIDILKSYGITKDLKMDSRIAYVKKINVEHRSYAGELKN